GQIERNSNDGFTGRASPLVSEITRGTKFLETFTLKFAIELLHKALQRRSFQFQPQIAYGLAQDFLDFGRCFFKGCAQAYSARRLAHAQFLEQCLPAYSNSNLRQHARS